MMPHWAGPGAHVICIDDAWTDCDTGERTNVQRPVKGGRYTIAMSEDLGIKGYIVLAEFSLFPDLWDVSAFRPPTAEENAAWERDRTMFGAILKDASVGSLREMGVSK